MSNEDGVEAGKTRVGGEGTRVGTIGPGEGVKERPGGSTDIVGGRRRERHVGLERHVEGINAPGERTVWRDPCVVVLEGNRPMLAVPGRSGGSRVGSRLFRRL